MSDDLAWSAEHNTVREVPATPSGILCGRHPDGSVVIQLHGEFSAYEIPEHEWVGIVAAVTKDGATKEAVRSAAMVHSSQTAIRLSMAGKEIAEVMMVMADDLLLPKPKPIVVPDNPRGVIGADG